MKREIFFPGYWPVSWLCIQGPRRERTTRLETMNSAVETCDVDGNTKIGLNWEEFISHFKPIRKHSPWKRQ